MSPHPQRRFPRLTPLAMHLAIAGLLAGAPLHMAQAAPAPAASIQTYAIAAGKLGDVLADFAATAGVPLSFEPAQLGAARSAGLHGSFTVAAGFAQLLAGSGLEAVDVGNGAYALRKAGVSPAAAGTQTLPGIAVTASVDRPASTEGSGSYTTRAMGTASKLTLSARETPQSVGVVTRQQLDDRGFQSLDEAVQDATGITTRQIGGGERTQFFSRGFAVNNFMLDGVPVAFDQDTMGLATMAMVDHVEVLRGAAGIVTGTGNPSGTINLVRKRPGATPQVLVNASAGSWDNYRAELDAGGALNASGSVRGRAVLAAQDSDTFKKAYRHERRLAYGTLDIDLAPGTVLSVGAYASREDNPGADWNGLPTRRDGSFYPFSRSARMTPDWAYWNKDNRSAFAELDHQLAGGWRTRVTARALETKMAMLGTYLYPLEDSSNFGQGVGKYAYKKTQLSVDAYASGPFRLFGRTHELVVGGSYRRSRENDGPGGWPADYNVTVDPLTWNSSTVPQPAIDYLWSRKGKQAETGLYATARLQLADPLTAMLGARVDSWHYRMHLTSGTWQDDSGYEVRREVTPYAGLVYQLDARHSAYASWTSVFQPQNYQAAGGALLDPVTGSNAEAGVKGEYFGGALTASAALFQIEQKNLPLQLAQQTCRNQATSCYRQAGEVRSRGAEFELAGALSRDWQVLAGYTWNTSDYVHDADAGQAGARYDTQTPRHLFKLSTSYRLPGELSRWKLGGSLRTRSAISNTVSGVTVRQGGMSLLDLMASWQASRQLSLQLNVYNVFDKYYYQAVGSTQDNNHFGAPVNVLLSAKYAF